MLTELCAEVRNYFVIKIHNRKFTISGGKIAPLDFIKENQFFRIVGSSFNDGVYKNDSNLMLIDEEFCGAVWAMAVPPNFVKLAEKVNAYNESEQAKPSAFTSESFGGYSYSRATDKDGVPLRWQKVFAKELNPYRRLSVL